MPDRLSLAELQDLAADPRLQNPDIRAQVFAKLDPHDIEYITSSGPEKPLNARSTLEGAASKAGTYAKEHPAEVGGTVGGIAATAATGGTAAIPAILAAFLGGAGGAGVGMTTSAALDGSQKLPDSPTGVLKEMGWQGATQAGGEGVGRLTMGAGNLLMNEIVPTAISKDFASSGVNIGDVLNRRGINPTTARGAAKAERLRGASSAQTQQLANDATAQGTPGITRRDVAPFLSRAERQAGAEAKSGVPGGQQIIDQRLADLFDAQFPFSDISLKDAPAVTRVLQDEGRVVRRQVDAGKRPTDLAGVTADGIASGVRRTTADRVPGYEASNKTTQELVGAAQAADQLSKQPMRLGGLASRLASGGGFTAGAISGDPVLAALGAGVPLALGTPQIGAPVAIALYKAGKLPLPLLLKVVGPEALAQAGIHPTTDTVLGR